MKRLSNQSRAVVRGIFCISIILIGLSILPVINSKSSNNSNELVVSLSLTSHASISITSDSELEVFPGSGTEEDPYLIEGYEIITTDNIGISITGTTKYFIINNCYVEANYHGIDIYNVASGTAIITNNTCNNNGLEGIKVLFSSSSTIVNNTCNNNSDIGIVVGISSSSFVENNTCCNNRYYGIFLDVSSSSTIVNNTLYDCGFHIREYSINAYLSYTFENNFVNGKVLGLFINLDSTTISESIYSQLILVNCSSVIVRDQILNSCSDALFLYSCTDSVIINNTFSYSGHAGVYIYQSSDVILTNNTCSNNRDGIILEETDFCNISYNLLQNNDNYGVYLRPGSSNNIIHHNFFVVSMIGSSQARDDGTVNTWYDSETLEGNFWSDWSGTGSYSIAGSAGSVDLYPLGVDFMPEFSIKINLLILVYVFSLAIVPVSIVTRKRLKNK